MSKVLQVKDSTSYLILCPACQNAHGFKTHGDGATWSFNRDLDNPTVSPSLLVYDGQGSRCHSFIEQGKIKFLADCTHKLKGQIVELPDWDDWDWALWLPKVHKEPKEDQQTRDTSDSK